jgi:predicted AAA+ superfamily ATPase
MTFINRPDDIKLIRELIRIFPITAILGARQTGKTTLARKMKAHHYFDLENPRDLVKLEHPQTSLEQLSGLIVIDEIQRKPDLFPLLRYLVDSRPDQKYLILGSASEHLIKNSSESLAGRIGYFQLGGLRLSDVSSTKLHQLWLRGGLPRSFLADHDQDSFTWLNNYVLTFLERDIPQLGITIPAQTLHRFWHMVSHYHGQIINYSELARSFGISDMTVRRYLDILAQTFMIRLLQPWYPNLKKRLVKRPKLYIRDSGVFHSLQTVQKYDDLLAHPKLGASWEGFAIENTIRIIGEPASSFYFWRTHAGAELDLFWQAHGKNWGVEFKYADAPGITSSIKNAIDDLRLEHLWIVYPGSDGYQPADNISVTPLRYISGEWNYR